MMRRICAVATAALVLSACAGQRPATVLSTLETAATGDVGSGAPAIWRGGINRNEAGLAGRGFLALARPAGGLAIHDPAGAPEGVVEGGRLSDIDVTALPLAESYAVIIGGSRRVGGRYVLTLYRLDRGEDQFVRPWAELETDLGAPRAFCMRQAGDGVLAAMVDRAGEMRLVQISEGAGGAAEMREVRRLRLTDAGEGCAIDQSRNALYMGHARSGFWRLGLGADALPVHLQGSGAAPALRTRGFSVLIDQCDHYLVSLDEDRRALSIWETPREGGAVRRGRFEVRERAGGRAVRSVDGLDAYGSEFGAFPEGVVIVQDQANDGRPNLKLVSWREVWRALGFTASRPWCA